MRSPRSYATYSKLCIRKHRRYSFPNELNLNLDEDNTEALKGYYVFPLDCYEHSGIVFSLSGEGMQCQFDTARGCGIICYPEKMDGIPVDRTTAIERIRLELKAYNSYLNGED